MREYPTGGIVGKTVRLWRSLQALQVPLHAAYASFFLVLAAFPALVLLLSLLRDTAMEVEQLAELTYGILPQPLAEGAEELILLTWDNTAGMTPGISAAAVLWSAGRGIYGILTGLNAIYGVEETRGYFRIRLISGGYLLVFLVMLLLTLVLPLWGLVFPVPILQTGFFSAMFMALPGRRNTFRESLPGGVLAALGWQGFSHLYGIYVSRFAPLQSIFGSVYAAALSLLWLYCCMSILFYGGALNVLLKRRKEGRDVSET